MSEAKRCEGKVYNPNGPWGNKWRQCTHKAKAEVEGKHYCTIHNPERRAAKRAERDAAWRAKWKEEAKQERIERAAPKMLEALKYVQREVGTFKEVDDAIAAAESES